MLPWDDVLAPTGQRVPVSQLPSIGDRPQYQLFFDALNSRFSGRENLTHLVMYKKLPSFIDPTKLEQNVTKGKNPLGFIFIAIGVVAVLLLILMVFMIM